MLPPVTLLVESPRFGRLLLAAWFAAMVALGAGLMAKHVIALRAPAPDARLGAALGALRRPEDRGRFLAVHVLSGECRCSHLVVEHLASTVRPRGYVELVLWVGEEPPPDALAERGFVVRRVVARDLDAYGVESVPMLIALRPSDEVRYVGGYTTRQQGPVIEDLAILEAARAELRVPSLPIFGCAVGERLRRELSSLPSLRARP
jgi:hypothetical protein